MKFGCFYLYLRISIVRVLPTKIIEWGEGGRGRFIKEVYVKFS